MSIVVLDLEWNQGNQTKERQDPGMPFEVIEIGAVRLNDQLEHEADYSRLIRPTCYTTMHFITGKLLHISMEDLRGEEPFPVVLRDFLAWCGKDPLFCTWGPLDLTELQRNMRWHGLAPLADGPLPFLDAQKLFSIAFQDSHERISLEHAVDQCGIRKEIPFHRAHDDAWYTALILQRIPRHLFSYYSFDYFTIPENREHEVHVRFDSYAKYISRGFQDKSAALEDAEVMSTRCYVCGRRATRKISWFTPNGRQYYSVSCCPEHGLMKAKVRLRKAEDGEVYVVKTERFIGEKDVRELGERARKAEKTAGKKEYRLRAGQRKKRAGKGRT